MVQSMDPTNELLYLRVTSRYIELLGTILPIWGWQSTFLTANSREVLKVVNPMIVFFSIIHTPCSSSHSKPCTKRLKCFILEHSAVYSKQNI